MPIKRVLKDNRTYLYLTTEGYDPEKKKGKIVIEKLLGVEEPAKPLDSITEEFAVVWAENRTLGNAVPFSDSVTGQFPPENKGYGVLLPCDIVECGKFRNGKPRWWCRTHQVHWGTKADIQASESNSGGIRCANATQPTNYVKDPFVLNPDNYPGGIGIWAALPTAINTTEEPDLKEVEIHVRARSEIGGRKTIDANFSAVVVKSTENTPLFPNLSIKSVVIAPPSALAYLAALLDELPLGTLYCNKCQHPHLDLGDFAKNPHRKHFCGNCGIDSNWSSEPIVSSPLKELADRLNGNSSFVKSDRELDLRDYDGYQVKIWASTPAVVWTSELPQESGIHVHLYQGKQKIIDDSFGKVTWFDGSSLERDKLLSEMFSKVQKNPETMP